MDYLEITISTAGAGIEEVAAALTAAGFDDLVLEDQEEFSQFLEQNRAYWDYIDENLQQKLQGVSCIKLYLEDTDTAGKIRLENLLNTLQSRNADKHLGSLEMTVTPLPSVNWEESWKDNYPPQDIGSKLTILPYWLADTQPQDRIPVILDPGLTFGTGSHPSTKMVLEATEEFVKPGDKCIDFGSGSGILSIAALRLGAKEAIGIDIDPKAEDIARENAAYNHFAAPEFTALTGNVLTDKSLMNRLKESAFGIIFVNIVADVIISLAPVLPDFSDENTTFIFSGILDTRLQDVRTALEKASLTIESIRALEEWRCIIAKRRPL